MIGREGVADEEFSEIVALGRLGVDQWYVFDRGNSLLRIYDESAQLLRAVGGPGSGPGEFRYVLFAEAEPDGTIFVFDSLLRRVTRFDREASLLGVAEVGILPEGYTSLQAVGLLDSETMVWSSARIPGCVNGQVLADTVSYFLSSVTAGHRKISMSSADWLVPLYSAPGYKRWGNTLNPSSRCFPNPIPFTGPPIAGTYNGHLYLADRGTGAVTLIDRQGRVSRATASGVGRQPLTTAMVSEYIDRQAKAQHRDERGVPIEGARAIQPYIRMLRAMPFPDSLPVVTQMLVDELGYVWLEPHGPETAGWSNWWIVEPSMPGQVDIVLPRGFRVHEIGKDYIAGVARDENHVEQVVIYRLTRGYH